MADRGWGADLELWVACRGVDDSADAFGASLARAQTLVELGALADAWRRSHLEAPDREAIADALLASFEHGGSRPRLPSIDSTPAELIGVAAAGDDRRLQGLIASLARRRDDARCPSLVRAYCRWILAREPRPRGVDLLGAMRALGSEAADSALRNVVADGRRYPEELRRQALMQLLIPVQADLFDYGESLSGRRARGSPIKPAPGDADDE